MIFGGFITIADFNSVVAFVSGLLSFFSPCVLPLVPSYLIFISGISFDNYISPDAAKYRKTVLFHSIAFILGFSLVFVSFGFSSSFIGSFFFDYQRYIIRFGGLVLIAMGLIYLRVIKAPFLNQEKVIHLNKKPIGFAGSFIVGITFSLGWTPCVGPALSSILIIASTSENVFKGICLLSLYSLGLAIPFVVSALFFDRLFSFLKRYGHMVKYSMTALGALLIVIGILLVTNYYTLVTEKLGYILTF
ncbi:MAG: cytochrome c biogenesis protein CcdA [Syntrophobacterales bacterium]|jgi:cytochrome c-type biogenesis protein|nr:cytochrome c biogenesis protein CcdA [Syntrophobacterales bacterium]